MAGKTVENLTILDDSVIIEEGASPAIPVRRSSRHFSRTAKDEESTLLCEYPIAKSDTVTVRTADYATLENDTFLNDIIIDFYLTYLAYNILPSESRDSVHIFSTIFYKRLLQFSKKTAKRVAAYERDPMLTSGEKRHFRVAGWTKNVDLFEKDLVIVPICEHSHWYLVVLINPGLISIPAKSVERIMKGEPFVIVLDSLGGSKNSAVANLRQYLACEWRNKKCTGQDTSEELEFSSREMRTIWPSKPEQHNGSDCGIFLLHYVEKIFKNVKKFLKPTLPDLTYWFTVEEVASKRANIAELIRTLATEQRPGMNLKLPNIKLVEENNSTFEDYLGDTSSNELLSSKSDNNVKHRSSTVSISSKSKKQKCFTGDRSAVKFSNSSDFPSISYNTPDMATDCLSTSNSAGPSTKFCELRNVCKEKLEGHDNVSVGPVVKKKDDKSKRKRRHGVELFKRLQLESANSRKASLNDFAYVPEQNK